MGSYCQWDSGNQEEVNLIIWLGEAFPAPAGWNMVGVRGFEPPRAPQDLRNIRSPKERHKGEAIHDRCSVTVRSNRCTCSRRAVTPSWVLHPLTPTIEIRV